MAKDRLTGKGGLVKIYSGNTFVAIGLVRSITPPAQERAVIDVMGMEDTTPQAKPGTDELSEFTFQELYDNADTQDALIDAYYANAAEVNWQIAWTNGTSTWTENFAGFVAKINPQSVSGKDPVVRDVTVSRTGAITRAKT